MIVDVITSLLISSVVLYNSVYSGRNSTNIDEKMFFETLKDLEKGGDINAVIVALEGAKRNNLCKNYVCNVKLADIYLRTEKYEDALTLCKEVSKTYFKLSILSTSYCISFSHFQIPSAHQYTIIALELHTAGFIILKVPSQHI